MINNMIGNETKKKLLASATLSSVFFLFSVYGGYSSSISILFQLLYAAIIVYLFRQRPSLVVLPILSILSIRGYTQNSINSAVTDYYSLNSDVLLLTLSVCTAILLSSNRVKRLSFFAILPLFMFVSKYFVENVNEYLMIFSSICLLLLFVPYWIKDEEDIFCVHFSFVIAGLLFIVGVVPSLLRGNTIYEIQALVDRNYQSGMALLCALESLVFLTKYNRKGNRILDIISCISMIGNTYIIITSASRTAVIAISLGVVVYLLINKVNIKIFLLSFIIFASAIVVGIKLDLFGFIMERFMLDNVQDANGRLEIWPEYLKAALDSNIFNLLFGHGLVGVSKFGYAAHNVFISVLYSFGAIGLVSLLYGYGIIIRKFYISRQAELISFLPYIIMCCTIEPYYRVEYALFIPLMYGIALTYNKQ